MQFVAQKDHQSSQYERYVYILVILIISSGIILRAFKYIPGWSMRGDELAVTLNLLQRSIPELMTQPLASNQAAPVGFLFLEKILIILFGSSDYILRLPAFLAGCAVLFLAYYLLRKTSGIHGLLFALLGFAFGDYLIYYSSELKQYTTDVLVSLILLLLIYQHLHKETNAGDFFKLGIVGALAILFSHPAIFILAAIGPVLLLHYWNNKQKLWWTLLAGTLWAALFLALYLILLRHQTSNDYLVTFWKNLDSYMPLRFWKNPTWYPSAWGHLLTNIAGFSQYATLPLTLVYLLGIGSLLKERNWQWAAILVLPIAINLIASGFHKFPFHGRLILYLVPFLFVALAKGIDFLIAKIPNSIVANILFVGIVVLSVSPIVRTANSYLFTKSYVVDDMKPVLAFMQAKAQAGDMAYLYHYASSTYAYYAPSYHLETIPTTQGTDNIQKAKRYDAELSALPTGQRIWFVFSFVYKTRVSKDVQMNEREYMLAYLKEHGTMLDEYYSANNASSAHLFILK